MCYSMRQLRVGKSLVGGGGLAGTPSVLERLPEYTHFQEGFLLSLCFNWGSIAWGRRMNEHGCRRDAERVNIDL